MIDVEVLPASSAAPAAETAIRQLITAAGGRVTGSVPGYLIQASVPAAKVESLALSEPAELPPPPQALSGASPDEVDHLLDEARSHRCWESHLARAQWLSGSGYRRILEQAVAIAASGGGRG